MDLHKIIFESPLYSKWKNELKFPQQYGGVRSYILNTLIENFDERIELYCTECESMRIFAPDKGVYDAIYIENELHSGSLRNKPSLFKTFRCSKSTDHVRIYSFLPHKDELIKLAEYPTKYDSVKERFNKYKKIIGQDKIAELAKALQLEAYGYHIGSFLYYRRVFEYIILKTYKDSDIPNKIPTDEFNRLRMDEKVKYLKDHLSEYLLDNAHIYSVLSKGVHELSEEECEDYIPIVQTIIIFILDETLDNWAKAIRKEELSGQLKDIRPKLKGG